MNRNLGLIAGILLLTVGAAFGVEITIDMGQTYQTIEGLGLCGVPDMYRVKVGPFYEQAPFEPFADTLIREIGITMLRGFDTESCAFNPSPGEYVITDGVRAELERNRYLKAVADSAEQILRYSPNIFSPPGWMKANGECAGGEESTFASNSQNSLLSEHYEDFGALCARYIEICRDTFGLDVYALGPQNEPYFNEPYASCSYGNGSHYAQMLAVVGPAIRQANPATLIYGVEHMAWAYPSWESGVMANAQARDYLDRFAVHGAVGPTDTDTGAFDNIRGDHERPLWLSEFNWGEQTYSEALGYGRAVMKGLTSGNMSGYMAGGGLWNNSAGTKYPGYYINAQFFSFVRPGMKRIDATCADQDVMVGAFADESVGSFSVVLINNSTSPVDIDLSATGGVLPDQLGMRRTTATEGFVDMGLVSSSTTVSLPAESIVSLGHNTRAPSGTAVNRAASVRHTPHPRTRSAGSLTFDLLGRSVVRAHTQSAAGGPAGPASVVVVAHSTGASTRVQLRPNQAP